MKKLILIIMLLLITMQAQGTFTGQDYIDAKTYLGSGNKLLDPLYLYIVDAVGADTVGKSFFYYIPGTEPASTEGYLYYSTSLDALVLRTESDWVTLEAGGDFASLDEGYNGGAAIDVDSGAVTLTAGDADNNVVLALDQQDTANTTAALTVGSASDETAVIITQTGSGADIEGTAGWSIDATGVGTFLSFILENSDIINNSDNDIFEFDSGTEDFEIDLTGSNVVKFTSDTSADTLDFDTLDTLSGIDDIVFDIAGSDNTITCAGSTTGKDLIIQQTTSGGDASLVLQSTGIGVDAISIIASVASINIDSADNITIDAADDITITTPSGAISLSGTGSDITIDCVDKSLILDSGETQDDAIKIVSAGGGLLVTVVKSIKFVTTESETDSMNFDCGGGIDFDISGGGAGEDFAVTTNTSITLEATENHEANVVIKENGGVDAGINIWSFQGVGVCATGEHDASVQLHSTDGGIGLYSTADLGNTIRIETNGGVDENIFISSKQGTDTDSITLTSTLGGIAITANAAGKDVVVSSVLGSIRLKAEENAADAILLEVDNSTSTTIRLLATTGTSVSEDGAAIQLSALVGGIGIQSDANLDNAIVLRADGGAAAEITIQNEQGTTTDSIELLSDAGGIVITAAKPVAITNAFEVTVVYVPADDTTITILATDSGQVHIIPDLNGDTAFALPSAVNGLRYHFVYAGGAEDAQDWSIETGNNANNYLGGVMTTDDDDHSTLVVYSDEGDDSKISILTPGAGTTVDMWCDGTHWWITGNIVSGTDTAVVFSGI